MFGDSSTPAGPDMIVVGLLLISGLALTLVESVGYVRGGFNSEFWRLPLDDKLDRVATHRWDWWWISGWSLAGLFTMTAGVLGLAMLIAEAGRPVLGAVAVGGYLMSMTAWVLGLITQASAVSRAAVNRAETGRTPEWIHPLWDGAFISELVWIVGANLSYAVFGLAIVETGLVATWVGWAAFGLGMAIPVAVAIVRDGFPQLSVFVPALVGIALLIAA